ncbi:integrase core domain-containing protein [Streptomyces sp. NPDC093097]|uniref:integrase core domain-containing protein n=1 Tax=Streptomyces sp. NPDC093097 TaxID=3366027 RepID=UPI00380236CC
MEGLGAADRLRGHPVALAAEGNDNPYSQAHFKTTKYMSDHPERFDSLAHAREWFDVFIAYYNHEHRRSGSGWHTPASVHFGAAEEVRDQTERHSRPSSSAGARTGSWGCWGFVVFGSTTLVRRAVPTWRITVCRAISLRGGSDTRP